MSPDGAGSTKQICISQIMHADGNKGRANKGKGNTVMRARNLKPGFFKNEVLAECEPLTRILFEGLWCMADREGRLECRPKRIKAEILPYDNCDIIKLLEELYQKSFIIIYRYDNQNYLEIPTFTEHQNCHIKEAESTILAPYENESCTVAVGPLSSFLFPLTESPLPPTHPERKNVRVNQTCIDESFEKFWTIYPKKKSKGKAEKAWVKIKPSEQLLATIIAKIEQAKTSEDWTKDNGKYIPHPATWLNAKGWEDEYTPTSNNGNGKDSKQDKPYIPPKKPEFFEHENPDPEKIQEVHKLVDELTLKHGVVYKRDNA